MRVTWGRKLQSLLQCDLPRRAVEEVGSAYDVGDVLQRIIYDHGELLGEGPIAAANNHIATFA